MLVKGDFITNSSSTSFVCCICGKKDTVYGGGTESEDWVNCENGHEICIGHFSEKLRIELEDNLYIDHEWEGVPSLREKYPGHQCPVCSLKELNDSDLLEYLLWKLGITREGVLGGIQERWLTHEQFKRETRVRPTESLDDLPERQS